MSVDRVNPVTGTERQRQYHETHAVGSAAMGPQELHSTIDELRLWLGNKLVGGPKYLGEVASETLMLALWSVNGIGCRPGDFCLRTDLHTLAICMANQGEVLADWYVFPIQSAPTWESLANTPAAIAAAAALDPVANAVPFFVSPTEMALTALTPFARNIMAAINGAALRTLLSLAATDAQTFASLTLSGALTTGGPSGGSAPWKFGARIGNAVRVQVDGEDLLLALAQDSASIIPSLSPVAWFHAGKGVENAAGIAATDGQTVLNWLDQSGNGNHLAQVTSARRPTFVLNVVNGHPVVRFDHATQTYLINAVRPTVDMQAFTLIIVARGTDTNLYERFFVLGAIGSGGDYNSTDKLDIENGTTGQVFHVQAGPASQVNVSLTGSKPSPWARYQIRNAGSTLQISNGGNTAYGNGSVLSTATGFICGTGYVGGAIDLSLALDGDIAEIVLFDRALTDTELSQVNGGLQAKYLF